MNKNNQSSEIRDMIKTQIQYQREIPGLPIFRAIYTRKEFAARVYETDGVLFQ
jgi:hypothetical protein